MDSFARTIRCHVSEPVVTDQGFGTESPSGLATRSTTLRDEALALNFTANCLTYSNDRHTGSLIETTSESQHCTVESALRHVKPPTGPLVKSLAQRPSGLHNLQQLTLKASNPCPNMETLFAQKDQPGVSALPRRRI